MLNYTNFIGSHFGSFDDLNQLDFVDEEYAEKLRLDQYLQARQNLIDRDLHISSFCDDLIPRAKKRLVIVNIKFWQQLAIDTISIAHLE